MIKPRKQRPVLNPISVWFAVFFFSRVVLLGTPANAQPQQVSDNLPTVTAQLEMEDGLEINYLLFGIDSEWPSSEMRYDQPGLYNSISSLQLGALRFPGGEVSNYFDLLSGRFISRDRILGLLYPTWVGRFRRMSRDLDNSADGTRGFAAFEAMIEKLKGEENQLTPVWVLNLATQTNMETVRIIEQFKEKQISLRYVEMGSGLEANRFRRALPSVRDYLLKSAPIIRRIKTEFSEAQVALCANGLQLAGLERPDPRRTIPFIDAREKRWNDQLLKYRRFYDAWSVRSYGCAPVLYKDIDPARWDEFILFFPDIVLSTMARYSRRSPEPFPIWVTEYNLPFQLLEEEDRIPYPEADSYLQQLINSPLHGLHVASYLLSGIQHHDVYKVMMYHSLAGADGNAMLRFSGTNSTVKLTPAAQLFAQIAHIARENQFMHPIRVEGGRRLSFAVPGGDNLPTLQAAAFSSENKIFLIVLNRSGEPSKAHFDPGKKIEAAIQITYSAHVNVPEQWGTLSVSGGSSQWPWISPLMPEQEELTVPLEQPFLLDFSGHSLNIIEMIFTN
ncbi:MAG: hypothetical protein QGH40_04570 [bacterium]|jgi:hypothetical protein|nr:hypothetical protein [bacterium]